MSAREWEPGDVAMVTIFGIEHPALRQYDGWTTECGHTNKEPRLGDVTAIRPLAVIDPEDREQVERLTRDYMNLSSGDDTGDMRVALRSLITPLEPEEPTGLGAVAIDHRDMKFVRCADGWVFAGDGQHQPGEYRNPLTWGDLSIVSVRVLSEGIQ